MIPLRFHIVSLIAVFLALAIGIVVGSTVVDRAIVEGLENRIETVSENLDRRQQANEDLRAEISRLRGYVDRSAAHTVEGRLTDRTVAVVAARGVDGDAVEAATILIRDAGAIAPTVLWIEPAWALDDVDARRRLAAAMGIPVSSPATMRTQVWRMILEQLTDAEPLDAAPTSEAPSEQPSEAEQPALEEEEAPAGEGPEGSSGTDPLSALITAGFVTAEPVGADDPAPGLLVGEVDRLLLLGSVESPVGGTEFILPIAVGAADHGLPTLVAEVDGETQDPVEGGVDGVPPVLAVRADDELVARVATVDHLGEVTGRVATVLALRDLGSSIAGHYGFDEGADEVVPERASR